MQSLSSPRVPINRSEMWKGPTVAILIEIAIASQWERRHRAQQFLLETGVAQIGIPIKTTIQTMSR